MKILCSILIVVLILFGAIGILYPYLVSNNRENEIISVNKPNEIANLELKNTISNTITNEEEIKQKEEETKLNDEKEQMKESENKQNNNTLNNKEQNKDTNDSISSNKTNISKKVVRVTCTEINTSMYYLILNGVDVDGNIVWKYETIKEAAPQLPTIEYLGDYDHEIVYVNEQGTIKVLDFQTGKVLYNNKEYGSGKSASTIGPNGEIYLYGLTDDIFFVVDKKGKTLREVKVKQQYSETGLSLLDGGYSLNGDPVMEVNYENGKFKNIVITYKCENYQEINGQGILTVYSREMTIDSNNKVEIKDLDKKVNNI